MGNPGNGFALLNACRAHKRTGGNKEGIFYLTAAYAGKKMTAGNSRTAPAAGGTRLHLLPLSVIEQKPAIVIVLSEKKAFLFNKLPQKRRPDKAEVAG